MKKILIFELRKLWYKRIWLVPVVLAAALVLWMLIGGGSYFLRQIHSEPYRRAVAEQAPYWGKSVTEAMREIALQELPKYGIHSESPSFIDLLPVIEQYGDASYESNMAQFWVTMFMIPTEEELKSDYDLSVQYIPEDFSPREQTILQRRLARVKNPSEQQLVPGISVWRFWLDMNSYLPLILGIGVLGLIFLFTGDLFSREEGGGLREISLTKPRARAWIGAKILAAAITGGGIALVFYGAAFLVVGLLFGFQGWNCSPVLYIASGYVYELLPNPCTCLSLMLLRLALLTLGGAAMALLVAACSALLRQTLPAVGLALGITAGMESLLMILGHFLLKWGRTYDPILPKLDIPLLKTLLLTPVRLFLNVESLTLQFPQLSSSAYENELLHSMMMTPDLLAAFVGVTLAFMALCAALCFTYRRQR